MAEENTEVCPQHMVFTGPDYVTNHQPKVVTGYQYIGSGDISAEKSCNADYIFRPSKNNVPPIQRKHEMIGGIGWSTRLGVWEDRTAFSKRQRGGFWTDAEDRERHKIMTPSNTTDKTQSSSNATPARTLGSSRFGDEEDRV